MMVSGQNSFVASGNEYAIAGKLPGDQVHPQVSITTNGGYVVWEDYWIDGQGLGVGAMRLQNDLTGSSTSFRVNSSAVGDQESAQVSVLNNGGAAFSWIGGQRNRQHIYARFLSSSNSWLTGDVMVNSSTNRAQNGPVMATLLNGNVVIVYASRNQAASSSLADVYLQMFAPNGNKLGSEILVNQFTDNNQRSPAIAPLADGKFAIAWVSEQERWTDLSNGVPSVDIYARVFDTSGTAVGNEFLVNTSSNVCAAPDICAAADGGFMATWMEKDLAVRNNGWDIYGRRFSGAYVGGNVALINTQLYGDQHSPRIRRAGATYLDIWTSLGQDGSREGVFGRYLNDNGTVSSNEFRVNTTVFGSQMHPALGTDGAGRLLAVWTGFGLGVNGFDLYAQQYVNPSALSIGTNDIAFNADPNANPNSVSNAPTDGGTGVTLPGGGGSGNSGSNPTVTNSFADVKGTYNGLVYNSDGVTSTTSGYITITTTVKGKTSQGSFSAKLQLGTAKYSFSGVFDANGSNTTKLGALTINLVIDLNGGDRITGQISNGSFTASLLANRAVFDKTHPTSFSGNYTMVIQPGDGTMGHGIGTVKVDATGNVNVSLVLPDGTKLTQKTTLSKTGSWPLFGVPYKTGGVAIGWMQFGSKSTDGFDGQSVWIKPGGMSAPYTSGLTSSLTVSGSLYKTPPVSYRAFGNSKVIFNGGGLSTPITNSVTWGLDNKMVTEKGASLKLSLTASSGLFKGTTVDPATGHSVSFQGVLFEKNDVGLGFFLGGDQSGTVNFVPNN